MLHRKQKKKHGRTRLGDGGSLYRKWNSFRSVEVVWLKQRRLTTHHSNICKRTGTTKGGNAEKLSHHVKQMYQFTAASVTEFQSKQRKSIWKDLIEAFLFSLAKETMQKAREAIKKLATRYVLEL